MKENLKIALWVVPSVFGFIVFCAFHGKLFYAIQYLLFENGSTILIPGKWSAYALPFQALLILFALFLVYLGLRDKMKKLVRNAFIFIGLLQLTICNFTQFTPGKIRTSSIFIFNNESYGYNEVKKVDVFINEVKGKGEVSYYLAWDIQLKDEGYMHLQDTFESSESLKRDLKALMLIERKSGMDKIHFTKEACLHIVKRIKPRSIPISSFKRDCKVRG